MKVLILIFSIFLYAGNVSAQKRIFLGLCDTFPANFYEKDIDTLLIENGMGYCVSPFKQLDGRIQNFHNLTYFYLRNSATDFEEHDANYGALPEEIGLCKGLKNLSTNTLNEAVLHLENLEILDLVVADAHTYELLQTVGLGDLKKLEILNLSFQAAFPPHFSIKGLADLPNLREVRLTKPNQAVIDALLMNPNLISLTAAQSAELLFDFSGTAKIEAISITHSDLKSIPASIYGCKNVKHLDFTWNQIKEVDSRIGKLGKLEYLDLGSNELHSIAPEIGMSNKLQTLNLSRNGGLVSLPTVFGQLIALERLGLPYCNLTELPPSIAKCEKLTYLGVSHNKLEKIDLDFSGLTELKGCNVSYNQLRALPPALFGCSKLENLDISYNKILYLTDSIGALTRLKQLDAHNNEIRALPDDIGDLQSLERLSLYVNQLTHLPVSIVQLVNLKDLYVGNNQLTAFPVGMNKLLNLQTFELQANPLIAFPSEIYKLPKLERIWVSEAYSKLKGFKLSEKNPNVIVER